MKFLESRVAVLLSVFVAIGAGYLTYDSLKVYEDVRLTATTFATISATLFGFLMTSLSILIAISDRDFIRNLRLTGHYKVLVSQLFSTAGMLLISAILALCGHVVADEFYKNVVISSASSMLVFSLFSFVLAGAKFKKVILLLIK